MEEFLKQNYSFLYLSIEILAAITGILCWKKYKVTTAKFFILFLVYVVFVELIGGYPKHVKNGGFLSFLDGTVFEENYWWYTLLWGIGSTLFIVFLYKKIIEDPIKKKILTVLAILFLAVSIVVILMDDNRFFYGYVYAIDISRAIVVCATVFLYFFYMLQSDKILVFYKSLYFYIAAAVLLWTLVTTPLMFYNIYFSTADWSFVILRWQIYLFANLFMYSTFIFALIYCTPEHD